MTDDIVTRVRAALEKLDAQTYGGSTEAAALRRIGKESAFIAAARTLVPELLAEVEFLHSWDGLMSLLDEHWPSSIFPTLADGPGRDPGPRIVSLLRWVEQLNTEVERLRVEAFGRDEQIVDRNEALHDVLLALKASRTEVERPTSALDRVDELAREMAESCRWDGTPSVVGRAFGQELHDVMRGDQ